MPFSETRGREFQKGRNMARAEKFLIRLKTVLLGVLIKILMSLMKLFFWWSDSRGR